MTRTARSVVVLGLLAIWGASTLAQAPVGWPVTAPAYTVSVSAVNGAGVASGPIYLTNGSTTAPSLAFATGTGTGIKREAGDANGGVFIGNGSIVGGWYPNNALGMWVDSTLPLSWRTGGSGVSDVGISRLGSASLAIGSGTTGDITGSLTVATLNASNRALYQASADKLTQIVSSATTTGLELNLGTPTISSGSVTSGSHNTDGEVTLTGITSATVTFGAPLWTNAPFCTITPIRTTGPTTVPYLTGTSTVTSFGISGATSGDNLKIAFHCIGRIGT